MAKRNKKKGKARIRNTDTSQRRKTIEFIEKSKENEKKERMRPKYRRKKEKE